MSLVDIAKPPTADNAAIHLSPRDNIAVARVALSAGQRVRVNGSEVTLRDPIPMGHKLALHAVAPGGTIIRYGQVMGR
ncbi:MAG: altronate dehydratase, partial [Acidobacteria bacterium]|nr:altronate dehydratase [Acidobacteriota bacterium]